MLVWTHFPNAKTQEKKCRAVGLRGTIVGSPLGAPNPGGCDNNWEDPTQLRLTQVYFGVSYMYAANIGTFLRGAGA